MSQLNVCDTEAKAPDDQNGNVEEECGQDGNLEDDTKLEDVTNKDRDAITINKTETDSPFDDGDEAIVEEMISEEGSSEKQNDITTHEETVTNEKSMVPEDDLPSSLDGVTLKHEAAVREQILLGMWISEEGCIIHYTNYIWLATKFVPFFSRYIIVYFPTHFLFIISYA